MKNNTPKTLDPALAEIPSRLSASLSIEETMKTSGPPIPAPLAPLDSGRLYFTDQWILQHVRVEKGARLKLSGVDTTEPSLHQLYTEWCVDMNIRPVSVRMLSQRVTMCMAIRLHHEVIRIKTTKGLYLLDLTVV